MDPRFPYGTTIFCDDIRHEITGQTSFIGCYQGAIFVPSFPVTLPKFAFGIILLVPQDMEDARKIAIPLHIYLPGDAEGKPSINGALPSPDKLAKPPPLELPKDADVPPYVVSNLSIVMAGMQIKERGRFKVRAIYNGDTVRLGTLGIDQHPLVQNLVPSGANG